MPKTNNFMLKQYSDGKNQSSNVSFQRHFILKGSSFLFYLSTFASIGLMAAATIKHSFGVGTAQLITADRWHDFAAVATNIYPLLYLPVILVLGSIGAGLRTRASYLEGIKCS